MGELIDGRTPEHIKRILAWRSVNCAELECDKCPNEDICSPENGNEEAMARDALALIERLESERDAALAKVPRWISVEDRLPEPFVSVLVQMPGEEPHPTVREGFISDDGIWCAGHFKREPDEVTHWAKMPEPPKGRSAT